MPRSRSVIPGYHHLVWVMLSLSVPHATHAADALIEGGRLCTQQFPVQEQRNNIPTHLLAAISTTESGRWHEGLGMAVPWPWTINVEGKGYYFKSKAEAMAQTRNLIAQGYRSIDVGCMQVNLKHHPKAFTSLEDAFDPEKNVTYAAKFLHDNYAELGDWIKATAAYHSRTQVYGQKYLAQIERSWNKIVAKVSAARANQSGQPAVSTATRPAATTAASQVASRPIASTHNVRMVKVKEQAMPRDGGVLVIRGAGTSTPPTQSAAAELPTVVTPTAASNSSQPLVVTPAVASVETPVTQAPASAPAGGNSIRRVALDNAPLPPQRNSSDATSKFVFTN